MQTSVQGATVLYSRDLLTSALRSFATVLAAVRAQRFCPDKTRSGMITPAAATPAGAPCTPLPACGAGGGLFAEPVDQLASDLPTAMGLGLQASDPAVVQPVDIGKAAAELERAEIAHDLCSPCTPVTEEFAWPSVQWDDTVIDLEDQHDLLSSWQSGSEEESSSCADSDSSQGYDWDDEPDLEGASVSSKQPQATMVYQCENQCDP